MTDQPALGADAATVAEIDRLAAASQAAPGDRSAMDALWRAVYALDSWIFIARGEDDAPQPFIAEFGPGPLLMAFTTPERAKEGALNVGRDAAFAERLLSVPLPAAIDWAAGFAPHGVAGILFDLPSQGYFAPLQNLIPMRDWMAANPPG